MEAFIESSLKACKVGVTVFMLRELRLPVYSFCMETVGIDPKHLVLGFTLLPPNCLRVVEEGVSSFQG